MEDGLLAVNLFRSDSLGIGIAGKMPAEEQRSGVAHCPTSTVQERTYLLFAEGATGVYRPARAATAKE